MLKRKQYYLSLLIGVVAFLLFFIGAYLIISLQMPKPEAGTAVTKNEQSTNTLVEVKEEVPRIEIYTKITVQTVDESHKVVEKVIIPATTLLGMDEQNIRKRFEGYEVLKFNEKEVTLQKEVKSFEGNDGATYTLGINSEGSICIIEGGNTESFVDLGISAADRCSAETYSMLVQGKIKVPEDKREALLRNPNELDKILEAYVEANK
nr:hypothetical protein [uncultured Cellulosilyticum sp.]